MIEKLFKLYAARKTIGPVQLVLFITSRCNCFCQHCFYWKDINQKEELTLEEYEKISLHIGKLRTLCLTGGEPFLRKDIAGIVSAFHNHTNPSYIQIPTNGVLTGFILEATKSILFKTKSYLNISVSLDGFQEIHNSLRESKDCYQQAVDTIYNLKKLSNSFHKLTVIVCSNISTLTIDSLEDFSDFVRKELKPHMHMFEIIRGNPRAEGIKNINENKLDNFYKFIERNIDKYNESDFFLKRESVMGKFTKHLLKKQFNTCKDIFLNRNVNLKCYAPCLSNVIYPDGTISFCEGHKLDLNIKKYNYNLFRLLNSKEYKDLTSKAGNCKCTNGLYQGYNILLNLLR